MVFTLMYLAKKGKSNPAPWVVGLARAGRLSVIHFPKTPLTEHSRPHQRQHKTGSQSVHETSH